MRFTCTARTPALAAQVQVGASVSEEIAFLDEIVFLKGVNVETTVEKARIIVLGNSNGEVCARG